MVPAIESMAPAAHFAIGPCGYPAGKEIYLLRVHLPMKPDNLAGYPGLSYFCFWLRLLKKSERTDFVQLSFL